MAKLRVVYVAGPGNVLGTYRCWTRGEDDPGVPDVAYSRQFFDVCREIGAEAWVIAAHPQAVLVDDGPFRIEHRPIPLESSSGLAFHWGRVRYTLGIVRSARRFKADILIGGHGAQWFLLRVAPWFGIKVVPALHNTLWAQVDHQPRSARVLLRLARPLFASGCYAILSHPGACERQVAELTGGRHSPIFPFLSYYRETAFRGIPERGDARPPFRVLFVGRIEENKGVFDLLEVARQLTAQNRLDIEFDICGSGSQLDRLRQAASDAGVAARFRCHGRLEGTELRAMFGRSHVVVVPTRPEFPEGFNAVIAEAILCGRPVVSSKICPALELVQDAAVEVPPGDVAAYKDAIVRLCDDEALYEKKRKACAGLKAQFLDRDRSWAAAFRRIAANAAGTH